MTMPPSRADQARADQARADQTRADQTRADQTRAVQIQAQRAQAFRALHEGPGPLLLPNPWDAGSARLLASLGFAALATTSGGFAATLGRLDGAVTRDEALGHAAAIAAATPLPVSADLENAFADEPAGVAETIGLAAAAGLAGCSVEDFTRRPGEPIYDLGLARERVAAAAAARRPGPWCSPPAPRTTCTVGRTWPTPSAACRRTRKPAPTCCTRPG